MSYNPCASYQDMGQSEAQYMPPAAAAYMAQPAAAAESPNHSYVQMQGPELDVMAGGASTSFDQPGTLESVVDSINPSQYVSDLSNYESISYGNLGRDSLSQAIETELIDL